MYLGVVGEDCEESVVSFRERKTTSKILGFPKTLAIPPQSQISAVVSEVQERSSNSATLGLSCALPMNAFKSGPPAPRIAETTPVKIPSGPMAKMILSHIVRDSLSHCFVTCSPKSAMMGAYPNLAPALKLGSVVRLRTKSVDRLFTDSSQLPASAPDTRLRSIHPVMRLVTCAILSYIFLSQCELQRHE